MENIAWGAVFTELTLTSPAVLMFDLFEKLFFSSLCCCKEVCRCCRHEGVLDNNAHKRNRGGTYQSLHSRWKIKFHSIAKDQTRNSTGRMKERVGKHCKKNSCNHDILLDEKPHRPLMLIFHDPSNAINVCNRMNIVATSLAVCMYIHIYIFTCKPSIEVCEFFHKHRHKNN